MNSKCVELKISSSPTVYAATCVYPLQGAAGTLQVHLWERCFDIWPQCGLPASPMLQHNKEATSRSESVDLVQAPANETHAASHELHPTYGILILSGDRPGLELPSGIRHLSCEMEQKHYIFGIALYVKTCYCACMPVCGILSLFFVTVKQNNKNSQTKKLDMYGTLLPVSVKHGRKC